jgi:hypothetical protein
VTGFSLAACKAALEALEKDGFVSKGLLGFNPQEGYSLEDRGREILQRVQPAAGGSRRMEADQEAASATS